MEQIEQMVDPDELVLTAEKIDSLAYIVQEMGEYFFEKFDPEKGKEDQQAILWEFHRNRAKFAIISNYLCQIQQELELNGIKR